MFALYYVQLPIINTFKIETFKCFESVVFRSSRPVLSLGKGALKIYSKYTREHPC